MAPTAQSALAERSDAARLQLRPLPPAPRVGAQWLGLARQLRRDVRAEDQAFDRALAPIIAPLNARLRRHPKLRHEQVVQAVRLYGATIPCTFRIGRVALDPDRAAFSIRETRVDVSWIAGSAAWPEDYRELGLSVCRFALVLRDGVLRQRWVPLAQVSLHALARRFERSGDNSPSALLADLAVLADADPTAGQVACAGGTWLGDAVTTSTPAGIVLALNVRTYVE